MSDYRLKRLLVEGAELATGGKIDEQKAKKLVDQYKKESGTRRQRAIRAIGGVTGLGPENIREKCASDDNADRIIRDIEGLLDD